MTNEEIKALLELEAKASPGPWGWEDRDKESSDVVYYTPFTDGSDGPGFGYSLIQRDSGVYGPDVATCDFIIAMRGAIRPLLLELQAARVVVAQARLVDNFTSFASYTIRDLGRSLIRYDTAMKRGGSNQIQDSGEALEAMYASKYSAAISDADNYLRSYLKHNDVPDDIEKILDHVRTLLRVE